MIETASSAVVAVGITPFAQPGTPVLTSFGSGVVLGWRPEGDIHEVRLWKPRGLGSATAFIGRASLKRELKAAVGFLVRTPRGRGIVTALRLQPVDGSGCEDEESYEVELSGPTREEEGVAVESLSGGEVDLDAAAAAAAAASAAAPPTNELPTLIFVFPAADVECVGAAVLPVVERLERQASRFLSWSAGQVSSLVSGLGAPNEDQLSFLDKLQHGLVGSGEVLLKKLGAQHSGSIGEEAGGVGGAGGDDGNAGSSSGGGGVGDDAGGEKSIAQKLERTRAAAKSVLAGMEDAGKAEARVKELLGLARQRMKELSDSSKPLVSQAAEGCVSEAASAASHVSHSVDAGLSKAEGGLGLDELAEVYSNGVAGASGLLAAVTTENDPGARAAALEAGKGTLGRMLGSEEYAQAASDAAEGLVAELSEAKKKLQQEQRQKLNSSSPSLEGDKGGEEGGEEGGEGGEEGVGVSATEVAGSVAAKAAASAVSAATERALSVKEIEVAAGEMESVRMALLGSLAQVLAPAVKAATAATLHSSAAAASSSQEGQHEEGGGGSEVGQGQEAKALAVAEAVAGEQAALVRGQLEGAKVALEAQVAELSAQVSGSVAVLKGVAEHDPKLRKILTALEGQGQGLGELKGRVTSTKAAVEALKGKDMVVGRVSALLAAPEVDTLKETAGRIGSRFMDKESAARKKGDQLVRALTSKLQTRMLGLKKGQGGGGEGAGGGGWLAQGAGNAAIDKLYELLNVDALLESVEKDLTTFLMAQHTRLVTAGGGSGEASAGSSGSSVVQQAAGALDGHGFVLGGEAWDPRLQFMVSFVKDCAKVSVREQLCLGLDGLQARLDGGGGGLKVPAAAVARLEAALLDLWEHGGGAVAVKDLGAFWQFLDEGSTLEEAGRRALALLPDDPVGYASEAGKATLASQSAQAGLAAALHKLGGISVPQPLKELAEAQGYGDLLTTTVSAENLATAGGGLPFGSVDEALSQGVGLLNSESVVLKVQRLVEESGGVLGSLEAMRNDTRVQVALATLGSQEMEEKLMRGIETVDVARCMDDAELALTDQAARQRVLDGMKDACLEFLLQYLPSMPIPPIDGEEDGLEYSVNNLDLSRFKLKKEDVSVVLGDLSKFNKAAHATAGEGGGSGDGKAAASAATGGSFAAAAGGDPMPPPPPPRQQETDSTLLTLRARNISAEFVNLHWSYKQKYFPYLEGGGSCDALVTGCDIAISFQVRRDFRRRRTPVPPPPPPPPPEPTSTANKGGSDGAAASGQPLAAAEGDTTGAKTAAGGSGVGVEGRGAGGGVATTTGSEGGSVLAAILDVATGGGGGGGGGGGKKSGDGAGSGSKKAAAPSLIWEPVLILGECEVTIEDLSLRMGGGGSGGGSGASAGGAGVAGGGLGVGVASSLTSSLSSMAWVYNILASLFRRQIREYIISSLVDTIHDNAEGLLQPVNGFVRSSWPVVSAASHANLDALPLLDKDVAAGQQLELKRRTVGGKHIRVTLTEPGPLGLHLDINTKRGIIRFSAPVAGGQAEAQVRQLEASLLKLPGGLKGAYLVHIDSESVSNRSISEALVLLKSGKRPVTLAFVMPAVSPASTATTGAGNTVAAAAAGAAVAGGECGQQQQQQQQQALAATSALGNSASGGVVQVPFTTSSLGLKIKPSSTVPELIAVKGFARDPADGSLLPAEASGLVQVGMLLVKVNATPLWGLPFKAVAKLLKEAAQQAQDRGGSPPCVLTLCGSPDGEVRFASVPRDLMLARVPMQAAPLNNNNSKKAANSGSSGDSGSGSHGVVVAGFHVSEVGAVEATKLVLSGDVLVKANGVSFPSPRGYRDDVGSLKRASYPLVLTFEGNRSSSSSSSSSSGSSSSAKDGSGGENEVVLIRFDVTLPTRPASGRLGVVFGNTGNQDTGQTTGAQQQQPKASAASGGGGGCPVVKRFDPVPGVAASTEGVRPGLLLLAVGKVPVDPSLCAAQHKAAVERAAAVAAAAAAAAVAATGGGGGGGGAGKGAALASSPPPPPLPPGGFECASVEECVAILRDASFPKTPVLFRDMEKYLALRALAMPTPTPAP